MRWLLNRLRETFRLVGIAGSLVVGLVVAFLMVWFKGLRPWSIKRDIKRRARDDLDEVRRKAKARDTSWFRRETLRRTRGK